MMKRPTLPIALLYVGGILLAGLPSPLIPLFSAAIAFAVVFLFWPKARMACLCALVVLAGWINLAHRKAVISPHDLRTLLGGRTELATVRGVLRDSPSHRMRWDKQKQTNVWSSIAQIELQEVRLGKGDWQPAHGRIVTTTSGALPDSIFGGQKVEVAGVLRPAPRPVAEGLFDYRAYLSHLRVYYQLPAQSAADWQVVSSPSAAPLSDRFLNWARKTTALGLPVEDETLRLEWALTLGWKTVMTEEVSEPFIRSATFHIFAVDGLRIAIISGILLCLLRVFSVPRAIAGLMAIPIVWFYTAMTGWPASAIRALIMAMIVFVGWSLRRPGELFNSLFAAGLVILLWEPSQLFQAGFQLSFFVVLSIILILPFFNRIGTSVLKPDPLLPESLQPRWKKIGRPPVHFTLDLFLTSMAAWLGSLPLVAYYFHLITPTSSLSNMPAVPLCTLVLICNLGSVLTGGWLPFAAELFNHAAWFFMESIRVTSHWSATWPAAYYYVPMPGLFTIGMYYLILVALLTGWLFKERHRKWKIGGLAALCMLWCAQWLWQYPTTRMTILPLEGGHAVYAQMPGWGNDWLVDCGNESSADSLVKDFLRAQGVNRLSNLILTHGEAGYTGGAETVRDLFDPENIYVSAVRFRSPSYNEFLDKMKREPSMRKPVRPGSQLGPFRALYPGPEAPFSKADDNALVLRAELRGLRVLFLSNLGQPGQGALLQRNPADLRADIVVAAIPGANEPLTDALLDAVQPRAIVVADSQFPAYRKAGAKLRERLSQRNIPVIYTSDSQAVTLTVRGQRWELRGMDGTRIHGAVLPANADILTTSKPAGTANSSLNQ